MVTSHLILSGSGPGNAQTLIHMVRAALAKHLLLSLGGLEFQLAFLHSHSNEYNWIQIDMFPAESMQQHQLTL